MSEINASKVEFKLELADAGLNVLEYIPERITPPIVIINSAQPYLQTAQFGEWSLGLEVVMVASTATNKMATENLDQLIEDVLNAIEPLKYVRITSVNQPYNLQTNNAEYLAANMFVQLDITL
jgi:alpha-mannosidase